MFIVVAGGGKVGYHLARALVADHEVLVIELDTTRVEFIAQELGEDVVMQGDACDAATMERAGMERADLVVAVTGDDDDNLTFCQIAKARFHVERSVARINNPQNETLFRQLGVDTTVSATGLIMGHIEQELPWRGMIPLLRLGGYSLEVVELRVPRDAAIVGKQVRQLLLPQGSLVCLVIDSEGTPRLPTPDTTIHEDDILVAVTSIEGEETLRNALTASPR
ncbi:MAG TPA: TrkA family potassium uptake protein [Dehalococcoidia bacterium]|nr:TrkA family potassium uptake protein [Dehalococcoidia bacterium]